MKFVLVKQLRIWTVVLLALLLPVRGVMAATMLCAPSGEPARIATEFADRSATHVHDAAGSAVAHDHQHHGHDEDSQDHSTHSKCNVCSSSCTNPPLPSASSGIGERGPLTALSFADFSAPAPMFLSDGQERPPRTS